jgi:serine/threonine protein phosphatase 1
MKRYIVTTDVHGCYDELLALLAKLNYDPASDFLINLGDIIHRGPNSKGCVDVLRANASVVIMGNHEEKELKIRKARNAGLKKEEFTFTWNDDHLAVDESLTELDVNWLSTLPYYYKLTIDGAEGVRSCQDAVLLASDALGEVLVCQQAHAELIRCVEEFNRGR